MLVVIAFACGLNQLYWYYAASRAEECNECLKTDSKADCDAQCDKTLAK